MKKVLMLLVTIITTKGLYAQLTKGNWLVGGNGKFYSYTQDFSNSTSSVKYKYTDIGIFSSVGYFVANNFAVGLRPSFSSLKGKGVSSTGGVSGIRTNTQRYGIGPFVRYYFLQADKPFNIVSDLSYQLGTVNPEGESGKMSDLSLMLGPVVYFNSSVGIEFLLGYSARTEELDGTYRDVKKGFQFGIGFQIHLEKE